MKVIIEIVLALIFSVVVGTSGVKALSFGIKKEDILKVSKGLGSIETFTSRLIKK